MAGIRQHILPRLLLKGFASRVVGEETFTWLYRKETSVSEPNITNVSVEKYFYGKEGELSVDKDITDLETNYGTFLDELREGSESEVHDPRTAEFVAHLCVRTKHFRDSFRESAEFLIDRISDHLSNPENIKHFILGNPNLAEEVLDDLIKDYPIPPLYRELLLHLVRNLAPTVLDGQKSELQTLIQPLMASIRQLLPNALKEGHIKALAKNPVPEPRVKDYERLTWFVFVPGCSIILGDSGCLFETSGAKSFKALNDQEDEIRNIFLPISKDRVLVGSSDSSIRRIDFQLINEATAKCSKEFFISSECGVGLESLQSVIGEESEIISKEELEQIVTEAFRIKRAGVN